MYAAFVTAKKPDKAPSTSWVKKLGELPHYADPIYQLAKHSIEPTNYWSIEKDGRFHFSPPKEWLAQYPISIPKGMRITDRFSAPFSPEICGGKALTTWLTIDALPVHGPRDYQLNVLQHKADRLATAMSQKLGISPLQARLYIPTSSFQDATRNMGHEVAACLVLGTTEEHGEKLRVEGFKALTDARKQAWYDKAHPAPPHPVSEEGVNAILNAHRTIQSDGTSTTSMHNKSLAFHDLCEHFKGPGIIATQQKNGSFRIPDKLDAASKRFETVRPKKLGLPDHAQHVLMLPLDDSFSLMPKPTKSRRKADKIKYDQQSKIAAVMDYGIIDHAIGDVKNGLGGQWHIQMGFSSAFGHALILSVDSPQALDLLKQAQQVFMAGKQERQDERREWQDYLADRGVAEPPPLAKGR